MKNFLDKYFGRFGNRLFQTAFLYAYSKEHGIDYYFQDPKWFEKYEKDIQHLFGEGVGFDPRVSIQVRRGDYVGNPFYVDLMATDYYWEAMKLFVSRKFLVFSDDIEWCKKQEIFKDCDFSEGLDDIDSFNAQASCNGHIIANSSWGWWCAYLGPGKVIAPKAWYSDGITRTVCPKDWIRI